MGYTGAGSYWYSGTKVEADADGGGMEVLVAEMESAGGASGMMPERDPPSLASAVEVCDEAGGPPPGTVSVDGIPVSTFTEQILTHGRAH